MNKLCSSHDLQFLNDRYEYRIFAVAILDHILVDSKLSDGAKTLWMTLYRGAGLTKDMKCEASVSFLKNMTGKSESTLWRLIRELRKNSYLNVETREGKDGKNLPNIYGPRLPATVIKSIKSTATPREQVSTRLGYEYITATIHDDDYSSETIRDYENEGENHENIADDLRSDQLSNQETHSPLHINDSESFSSQTDNNTSLQVENAYIELTKDVDQGENCRESGYLENDIGGTVKSGTQYTNTPTEINTKTLGHSRDQWKMFPHIRTLVRKRLSNMGIDNAQSEKLIKEIDWTIHFGSMGEWPVQKAINTCLKLISSQKWATPRTGM